MNIYWYKSGADAHWNTVTGNWWTDAAHTQQAGRAPTDGDYVYVLGAASPASAIPPDTAAPTMTLAGYDSTGFGDKGTLAPTITAAITIAADGTLRVGRPAKYLLDFPKEQGWGGVALNGATVVFTYEGTNYGTLGDHVSMLGSRNMPTGVIGNHLTAIDSFLEGTIGDYLSWDSSDAAIVHISILGHTTVGNYATFSNSAAGAGNVRICDACIIGTNAVFNDDVFVQCGTVGANARFNEHSWAGRVAESDPSLAAAQIHIGAGVVFASDHAQAGHFGATVFLAANTTFGGGSIDFNSGGSPAETVIDVHDPVAHAVFNCTFAPNAYTMTGTNKVTSTMVSPAATDVRNGTSYDTAARTGTAHIPAATDVKDGVDVDATTGTYPTTATSQAAQLATDQGVVLAAAGSIKDDATILGQAGLYDFTAAEAAAAAGQLVTDKAAVDAEKANIVIGTTILTKAGSYPTTATSKAEQLAADQAAVDAQKTFIVTGHTILTKAGSYPTTATSKAEQLSTDQGVVLAAAASIKDDATILGQAGTFDFVAAEEAAAAGQLVTDQGVVLAAAASIKDDTTILGQAGTYDFAAAESREAAEQLEIDQAAVLARAGDILLGVTILGQAGTLVATGSAGVIRV
jgi:hypothetical protein